MNLCHKQLPIRGKYKEIAEKKCYREEGHEGSCDEFHYLSDLAKHHPRVANKIKRDATKQLERHGKAMKLAPTELIAG